MQVAYLFASKAPCLPLTRPNTDLEGRGVSFTMVLMAKILRGVKATAIRLALDRVLRMALRLSRRVACLCLERTWAPHHDLRCLPSMPENQASPMTKG